MFEINIVHIVFRLLNFTVFVLLVVYIFKKYLKNRIDEKITQKEALLKGLEEQGYFLEGRSENLEQRFKKQERTIIALKQKIDEWNASVLAEHNQKNEEYAHNISKIEQQIRIKNENVTQHALRTAIIPEVIEKTKAQLRIQFDQHSQNKAYVDALINRVARK